MEIQVLKQFSIFNGLEDQEIELFNTAMKALEIPTGDTLFREGEIGDSIYLLLEGDVEINQALTLPMNKGETDNREKAIINLSSELKPLFGEMSLFSEDTRRTASVKALSNCSLIQIMKSDLFRICDLNPSAGYKVMQNLCKALCNNLVTANRNVLKLTTAFSLVLEK